MINLITQRHSSPKRCAAGSKAKSERDRWKDTERDTLHTERADTERQLRDAKEQAFGSD